MTRDEVEGFIKRNIDKVAQIEVGQCRDCGEYVLAIIPGKNAYIDLYGVELKGNRLVCAKCGGKVKHIETRRQAGSVK